MQRTLISFLLIFLFIQSNKNLIAGDCNQTIYEFGTKTYEGDSVAFTDYKDKVLLFINVPTFNLDTNRIEQYQELYEKYKTRGFEIFAFPSAHIINGVIKYKKKAMSFNDTTEYDYKQLGVTFQFCEVIKEKGFYFYPLYDFLIQRDNFFIKFDRDYMAFIVGRNGKVLISYDYLVDPLSIVPDLENILDMSEDDY